MYACAATVGLGSTCSFCFFGFGIPSEAVRRRGV